VLRQARLGMLIKHLDVFDNWSLRLSPGEQQRLAFARALLQKPDFLFLDEATSALDEETEGAMYQLMVEALPDAAIVSIAHRSTVAAFHDRRLHYVPVGDASMKAAAGRGMGKGGRWSKLSGRTRRVTAPSRPASQQWRRAVGSRHVPFIMAGLEKDTPHPTALTVHTQSRVLEIGFDNGRTWRLPFELLRVSRPPKCRATALARKRCRPASATSASRRWSRWATTPSRSGSTTATTPASIRGNCCTGWATSRMRSGRIT
jgi:hypothetical protein